MAECYFNVAVLPNAGKMFVNLSNCWLTKCSFIDHISHNILNAAEIILKLGNWSPIFVVIIQFLGILGQTFQSYLEHKAKKVIISLYFKILMCVRWVFRNVCQFWLGWNIIALPAMISLLRLMNSGGPRYADQAQ